MITYDNLDDAFVGIARQFNTEVALYDYEKVINLAEALLYS